MLEHVDDRVLNYVIKICGEIRVTLILGEESDLVWQTVSDHSAPGTEF